jgi:hypothetical protein
MKFFGRSGVFNNGKLKCMRHFRGCSQEMTALDFDEFSRELYRRSLRKAAQLG